MSRPIWLTPLSLIDKARCLSHLETTTSVISHLFWLAEDYKCIRLSSTFLAVFPCLIDDPQTMTLVIALFLVNERARSLSVLAMVSWLIDEP